MSRELRERAWSKLSGNWGGPIAVSLVFGLIIGLVNGLSQYVPFIGLASIVVSGPLAVGLAGYFLSFAKSENPVFDRLFDPFKNSFGNSIVLSLLTTIFVLLWMLLLIIPGLIKAIAYSMAPYLLSENPNMSPTEALDESQRLMNGHKMDFFVLGLSFLGWILLGLITLGIAFIWVSPYISAAQAEFYLEITGGNNRVVDAEVSENKSEEDTFESFLK